MKRSDTSNGRQSRQRIQRRRRQNQGRTDNQTRIDREDGLVGNLPLQNQPDQILDLQQKIGNQAVQRLLNPEMKQSNSGDALLSSFSISSAAQKQASLQRAENYSPSDDDARTAEMTSESGITHNISLQRNEVPDNTEALSDFAVMSSGENDIQPNGINGAGNNKLQRADDPPQVPPPPIPQQQQNGPPNNPPPPPPQQQGVQQGGQVPQQQQQNGPPNNPPPPIPQQQGVQQQQQNGPPNNPPPPIPQQGVQQGGQVPQQQQNGPPNNPPPPIPQQQGVQQGGQVPQQQQNGPPNNPPPPIPQQQGVQQQQQGGQQQQQQPPPPTGGTYKFGKLGKHIGYGMLTMVAEQVLGPLADLKNLIRLGWYSWTKRGKTDTEKEAIRKKEDKVKGRVSEEWYGGDKYNGNTWMQVIHAVSTTSEKLAALAGAIAFLATIASAFAPPAAAVAGISGIIGAVLFGIALIGRSILSIGSAIKASNETDPVKKANFKEMAWGNFASVIKNVLGLVTFGIGAGVSGVDTVSKGVVKTGVEIGTDMAIGGTGAVLGVVGGEVSDKQKQTLQPKLLIQRDGEDKEEDGAKATLMELDTILGNVSGEVEGEKSASGKEKADLQEDKATYGKASGKLAELTGKTEEVESKSNEAKTEINNADSQAEAPEEGDTPEFTDNEIEQLDSEVKQAETGIEKGESIGTTPDIAQKKGFFSRVKKKAKSLFGSAKKRFAKMFAKLTNIFARVKSLIQKAKVKILSLVAKALGVSEAIAASLDEVNDQKEANIPAASESIDNQTKTMDDVKDSIASLD